MRRGNMMILALIACAMLALVLVCGVEMAGLRGAARGDEIGGLQLAQLHRTALADTLDELNASGAALSVGRVLLSDEPTSGQRRLVTVENVAGRTVWLESASSLADGGRGVHGVRLFALPLEARFAFACAERALYYDVQRDVPRRWLEHHAAEDLVILCDDKLRVARTFVLGDGGWCALSGSLLATHFAGDDFSVQLQTTLRLAGNAIFEDDLQLEGDLSCKNAWIDGTLTVGEGVRLRAETVVLGEDVPPETLARIDAATIYMPHPPETETPEEEAAETPVEGRQILPLAALPAQPAPERWCYLILGQVE